MTTAIWVLIVATHVNAGAAITMHDFEGRAACEYAASAARQVTKDAASWYADPRTWCVPKGEQPK